MESLGLQLDSTETIATIRNELQWSRKDYTLRDFITRHKDSLPVFIKVTQGYKNSDDDDDHDIATESIIFVYDVELQSRVVALREDEKYLMMSRYCPINFRNILLHPNRSLSEPRLLDVIVQNEFNNSMLNDVKIQLAEADSGGLSPHDSGYTDLAGVLRIIDLYDEKYLLGHYCIAGPVDVICMHAEVMSIPAYLPLLINVAHGMKNKSKEEFQSLINEINSSAFQIHWEYSKKPRTSEEEIVVFNDPPNCDYEYIESSSINLPRKPSRGPSFKRIDQSLSYNRTSNNTADTVQGHKLTGLPNLPPRNSQVKSPPSNSQRTFSPQERLSPINSKRKSSLFPPPSTGTLERLKTDDTGSIMTHQSGSTKRPLPPLPLRSGKERNDLTSSFKKDLNIDYVDNPYVGLTDKDALNDIKSSNHSLSQFPSSRRTLSPEKSCLSPLNAASAIDISANQSELPPRDCSTGTFIGHSSIGGIKRETAILKKEGLTVERKKCSPYYNDDHKNCRPLTSFPSNWWFSSAMTSNDEDARNMVDQKEKPLLTRKPGVSAASLSTEKRDSRCIGRESIKTISTINSDNCSSHKSLPDLITVSPWQNDPLLEDEPLYDEIKSPFFKREINNNKFDEEQLQPEGRITCENDTCKENVSVNQFMDNCSVIAEINFENNISCFEVDDGLYEEIRTPRPCSTADPTELSIGAEDITIATEDSNATLNNIKKEIKTATIQPLNRSEDKRRPITTGNVERRRLFNPRILLCNCDSTVEESRLLSNESLNDNPKMYYDDDNDDDDVEIVDRSTASRKYVNRKSKKPVTPLSWKETWKSADDVPNDISSLSVDEVTSCLQILNLHQYIRTFREQQIDGCLLCCLDKDILMADFGFRKFDAIKLAKFSRDGWRPKLQDQKHSSC